jgi:hypothetical protein
MIWFTLLKPNGNYTYIPDAVTISNFAVCIHAFCMILSINRNYFLEQRKVMLVIVDFVFSLRQGLNF